jgi:hypothetical protein
VHDSAWSNDLTVEVGGHGVVSHAGSAVLRLLADRTGLTGALSRAVRRRGFTPVHDRGRVLVDAAVCIAEAGEQVRVEELVVGSADVRAQEPVGPAVRRTQNLKPSAVAVTMIAQ